MRKSIATACIAATALIPLATRATAAPSRSLAPERVHAPARHARWAPTVADALTRAYRAGRLDEAEYALQRARSLFHPARVEKEFGRVAKPGPHDATPILRDLFAHYRMLSPGDRTRADVLLARPTEGASDPFGDGYDPGAAVQTSCTTHFCFHWVTTTADAATPAFVDSAKTVFENVWAVEISSLGFRAPKSDVTSQDDGGDGRLDVYLADVGGDKIYGYCTSDDPNLRRGSGYPFKDVSAYCVVDNDFAATQFSTGSSGQDALEVTAAHEFFHAVQFSYDAFEDTWLLEGSAVWMEDVVYDAVDDYLQYLRPSQMGAPGIPLDYSPPSSDESDAAASKYGAFLFFRYLSDAVFGTQSAPDGSFMQAIWSRADGASASAPDAYSLQAVREVIESHGDDFGSIYSTFGVANLFPTSFYEEGAAYGTHAQPPLTRLRLTGSLPARGASGRLGHLTHRYVDFQPGSGVARNAKIKLTFDEPPPARGARATVVLLQRGGAGSYQPVKLNAAGDAVKTVPFGRGTVTHVVVVLTNASTALQCFQSFKFSCEGKPLDDNLAFAVGGRVR